MTSRATVLATAFLIVGAGPGGSEALAAKTPETSAAYYDHAAELITKGDYRGAIVELKNALQRDPKDLSARVLLGRTYLKLENGSAAETELTRARKEGARDSFVLVPLGRALVMQWQFGKALKLLSTAGLDRTTAAEVLTIRGDAQLATRDFAAAEKSYLEASKMRPNNAEALVGLARVKVASGDLEGAKLYARWALQVNPDDANVWYVQGEVSRMRGKEDEALKYYDRAIELEPKMLQALVARAAININYNRYDAAEPDILTVRKIKRSHPQAAYLHSLILTRQGKVKEAQEALIDAWNTLKTYPEEFIFYHGPSLLLAGVVNYFRQDLDTAYRYLTPYVKRAPNHIGARKLLASIALTRGESKTALALLQDLVPTAGDDVEILIMYADALMRLDRLHEATKMLEKAAAVAKPGSSALSKLVVLRLSAGQDEAAIAMLKSEMKRDPKAARAALMLAITYFRREDFDAALKTVNQVIERDPKNAQAYDIAGGAYLGLKKPEEARRSYRTAMEADPDYLPAIENLAKVEMQLDHVDEAVRLFSLILEKNPRHGTAMISLAEIARLRNDMAGAMRWLEKASTDSNKPHLASMYLINLYIRVKRPDDAVLLARKLNREDAKNTEFLTALGRAQLAAKRLEPAVQTFHELSERAEEEKSAEKLHRAAVWQLRARDKEGARSSLNKALEIDSRYQPAHLQLFGLEVTSGNLDGAMARAEKVVTLEPAASIGYMLKGDVYMRMHRYEQAVKAYDEAFQKEPAAALATRAYQARKAAGRDTLEFVAGWAAKHPDDPAAKRLLASAYGDAGRVEEAIGIYEELLKAEPESTAYLNNIALLYQKSGDARAIEFARKAYDAVPASPATMDTYGWVLVQQGRTDEGLALLRNAKLRAPRVPEIRYHLAVAFKALGRDAEAREELDAAFGFSKSFEGVAEARDLLARLTGAPR